VPPNLALPLIYSLGLSKTWEICEKSVVCADLADILGSPWGEAKLGGVGGLSFLLLKSATIASAPFLCGINEDTPRFSASALIQMVSSNLESGPYQERKNNNDFQTPETAGFGDRSVAEL
jgi:hypothetical protein